MFAAFVRFYKRFLLHLFTLKFEKIYIKLYTNRYNSNLAVLLKLRLGR